MAKYPSGTFNNGISHCTLLTKLYRQGRLAADRPDYAESDEHDTATTDDAEPDEEEKLEEEKTILIDDEDAEEDESTSDFEVDNVDSDDASITGSEMSGETIDMEEDVRNLSDTSTSKSILMRTRRRVDEDEREWGQQCRE
jgi:hypothetical protein